MSNFSHAKINNNFKFHYWDPHYTLSANPDPTKAQNNKRYTCNFCNATFSGSAGRARSHIAGRAEPGKPKEVKDCPNPDPEIQRQILEEYAVRQQVLDDAKKRKLGEEQMVAPATFNVSPLAYADVELSSDSEPDQFKARSLYHTVNTAGPTLPIAKRFKTPKSTPSAELSQSTSSTSRDIRKTPSVSTQEVKDYYGKILKKTGDLKTNACLTTSAPPVFLQRALSKIHPSVLEKYYGCGLIAPDLLTGLRVLDLGCGSGRDCYVLSQLVGESGSVVGVDMTEEQLSPALASTDFHRAAFGYLAANTTFHVGFIERLDEIQGLERGTFDLIVSNCVVNLSPDKEGVLRQAYDLLKPGGELYFSDIYSTQRLSPALMADPILWGECLSGAMYWNDFLSLARGCGFTDPRLVSDSRVTVKNEEIEAMLGSAKFFSATYRLFKIAGLETDCEDYGHTIAYRGSAMEHFVSDKNTTLSSGLSGAEGGGRKMINPFVLDAHHSFETGKVYSVCGNTYRMLSESRFAPHFEFTGSFDKHLGIFPGCGKNLPFASDGDSSCGGSSSCC